MPAPTRRTSSTVAPVFQIADTPGNAGNRAVFFGTTNPMLPTSKFVLFYQAAPQQHAAGPALPSKPPSSQSPENQSFSYLGTRRTPKKRTLITNVLFSGNLSFFKIVRCFRGKNRAPRHRLPPSHKAVDLKSTADVRHANSLFDPTTSILDSTGR